MSNPITEHKASIREYVLHIPSKGYWRISFEDGFGWTNDITKATRWREDVIDKLPWKINDPSYRWALVSR